MEVVAADAAFHQLARSAGSEVATEEFKALAALSEIDHLRLFGMQLEAEGGEDFPRLCLGRPGLCLCAAEHDESSA